MLRFAGIGFDLGTQPLDVDVEGFGVPHVVGPPDPVDQLRTGQHPAGVAEQDFQQLELFERKLHVFPAHRHHVALHVHADRPGFQDAGQHRVVRGAAAQHRADPGHQLPRREGLGHIVVCTQFETDDFVDLAVFGGEHDHRDVRLLSQGAAHLGTGQARQHQVEKDEISTGTVEDL